MEKTQKILDIAERMKDLYVTYRKVWIEQKEDGQYHTERRFSLHDDRIVDHLMQKKTIGLTAQDVTKFMCFDIDYGKQDMAKAEQTVRDIVLELEEAHHMSRENILVSFSGSKGFHVEVFFNKPISINTVKNWYKDVVKTIGASTDKVEFRPHRQGIKLPLGIHKVTGKKCYLVDTTTLKRVKDEHIFNVLQLDGDRFLDNYQGYREDHVNAVYLEEDKAKEFDEVLGMTQIDIPSDVEGRCVAMLTDNQLIYADSRHSSTYFLAIYLKEQGNSLEETVCYITDLIENTYKVARGMIDKDTKESFAISEVQRLAEYVYKKDKKFYHTIKKEINIHENEILEVLKPKNMNLKQLAFIMMVHSKKYKGDGETFYMTYKQMADMGADKNGARLLKHLQELEKTGFLTIVERDRKKGLKHLPNIYKVNVSPSTENFIQLSTTDKEEINLEKVVAKLVSENVAKELISKKQYYEKFRPVYKTLAS